MVKHCSDSQRDMYNNMRQQVVDYFCPDQTVAIVDSVLAQIKIKAAGVTSVRSFAPKVAEFKCKACGHNEAWIHPTHDTCKKCAVVQDKIHQGKAYRDIKDREGDLNGVGMTHDTMMSHGYNMTTVPKQHSDPAKRLSKAAVKKLADMNSVRLDTKDKHILDAKRQLENISTKLHFNSIRKGALNLFARYINSVERLTNKNVILAACMFSTFKKPTGKVWVKKFSNSTYTTSRQRRLKFMSFKKPFKKPQKKYK